MALFSSDRQATIGGLGEPALIRRITAWLGPASPPPPAGIGDDAAVLSVPQGDKMVVSNDAIVLNRHFTAETPPALVGRKLVARNLSDLAAMGAAPHAAVIQLLCGADLATAWLEEFYRGIKEISLAYNLPIVGGDCAQTDNGTFSASLTAIGCSNQPLTRQGARPGDLVLVTGSLGGSILGKHLQFEPRLQQGQWLANRSEVVAMMDLTDGLSKDLLDLLPAAAGARIDTTALPLSAAAQELAKRSGQSALEHALSDGEDYELLFILDGNTALESFFSAWQSAFTLPIHRIGEIRSTASSAATIIDQHGTLIHNQGYKHFRPS